MLRHNISNSSPRASGALHGYNFELAVLPRRQDINLSLMPVRRVAGCR